METRERDHVHRQLPQIGVQLSWEPQTSGDAGHGGWDEMVEITVRRGGQLQRPEADVIQSLVVDTVRLVCVFY